MIAELGHLLAFFALACAALQSVLGLTTPLSAQGNAAVRKLAVTTGTLTLLSFVALIVCFVRLDFSVKLVSEHSHSLKPIIYRIAGTWGNHEGSMLLWCVIMSAYGAAAAIFMKPDLLRDKSLGIQGLLTTASLIYLLFASSPFTRISPAPIDGGGLNPLLQDPALAIHPPMLYTGYVGFSMVFSVAAAGLIIGKIDSSWAKRARPWALTAWSALTIGISLGAIWAYYELGWGGWWFWDPVENASFMPWLVGAALVHSLIVLDKRGGMASWTVFLSILAFCLSLLGTFLVRSGSITSVHTFATDPTRGIILLIGFAAAAGGALTLYAWRAPKLKAGPAYDPVSREGALVLNNLFLSVGAALVLVGTVTPMFAQAFNISLSIGEPYFHLTFAPMMAVLLLFLPLAQAATWRKVELAPLFKRFMWAMLAAAVVAIAATVILSKSVFLLPGVLVGAWVVFGVGVDLMRRVGPGGFGRVLKLPLAVWGMTLAHIGIGLFVIAATTETITRTERTFSLAPGQQAEFNGASYRFDGTEEVEGPNYYATRATITVTRGAHSEVIHPEKRYYPVAGTPTTEVSIKQTLLGDDYVALGETIREQPGVWRIRLANHPLMYWVWGGAALIAAGGFISLASRIRRSAPVRLDEGATDASKVAPANPVGTPA